ncbi:MAG: XRE family transcriptional regulator [Pelagimonas sp.]|jgi:transcriptional regulator with XRE-family HTH domain|nr:XRE family transcriptional regulator [Pelagimonas sp.]
MSVDLSAKALKIGDIIRRLRAERDMSLTGLAQRAEVSKSNLSKIENNAISPTFDTIERIARGLGVRPGVLLSDDRPAAQILSFSRAGEGAQSARGDYGFEYLFPDLQDRRMVPIVTEIHPSKSHVPAHPSSHGGEEFFYVLEGKVEFVSDAQVLRVMHPGDSVYFSSDVQHLVRNPTDQVARVLWVWLG